jgi:hypothetical protein
MKVRYAVTGFPITHSLSPILAALTAAHLREASLKIELIGLTLLESDEVTTPMAWAWAQGSKKRSTSEVSPLFGNPESFADRSAIEAAANEVLEVVIDSDSTFIEHNETLFSAPDEFSIISRGDEEAWISLTSPLKHQLSSRAGVICVDDSISNAAVNQLRWDGSHWHCAGTDGAGLLAVARHFGFKFGEGDDDDDANPLLCLRGGGGASRSCAASWTKRDGQLWWLGGRRSLDNRGPWVDRMIDGDEVADHIGPRLLLDFDVEAGISGSDVGIGRPEIILSANYSSRNRTPMIVRGEDSIHLDGRWLLAAQHLEAWARLFCPEHAHLLPGLGLTMTRLAAVEDILRAK